MYSLSGIAKLQALILFHCLQKWEELFSRQPAEGEEDPELAAEIVKAREQMGLFVRKTNDAFENEKPLQVEEQQNELIRLILYVKGQKESFNQEVLNLREEKKLLFAELHQISESLIEIQYKLHAAKRKPVPTVPILYPEERDRDPFEIDSAEVDRHKAELENEEGSSRYLEGSAGSRRSSLASSVFKSSSRQAGQSRRSSVAGPAGGGSAAPEKIRKAAPERKTPPLLLEEELEEDEEMPGEEEQKFTELELDRIRVTDTRYQHEQNVLIQKMERKIKDFDAKLLTIVNKKKSLSVELKFAEISMIGLYEESQVLKSHKMEEETLTQEAAKLDELACEIEAKIGDVKAKLEKISAKVTRFTDLLRATEDTIAGELADNKHAEYLKKLYHLKDSIKSSKMPDGVQREHSVDKEQEHPLDLDKKALEFVLDMRKKRFASFFPFVLTHYMIV